MPERVLRSVPRGAPNAYRAILYYLFVMFLIKKIIEAFVLPPGCYIVALAGLAFYLRKRTRAGALVCAGLAGVMWVGTSNIFGGLLLGPLERAYPAPAKAEGDVIVVLCGGFKGGGRPFSASERLASGTLERADAAFKLHKETGLPLLISGGAPFSESPEAEAAAAYLKELGVPENRITREERSRDTQENARFSLKICGEKGYKRIILLTSAYHMPRSVLLFREAGSLEIVPFPVVRRSGGPRFYSDYLPGGGLEARQALNEYLGILYYRLYYSLS